jgi:hypothetical protein
MNRPRLFSFVTLVAVAGCSAQADTTYRGEALVRLHGTVVNTSGQEPPPLDAALVWGRFMLDNSAGKTPLNTQQVVASKIAVTGQFPNSFTMQVMTPPPNDVMVACAPGDPTHPARFAVAAILGLRQGADDANVQASDIFGNAPDFLVVYSDADLARDDCPILSPITISGFSKGYHLLQPVVRHIPRTLPRRVKRRSPTRTLQRRAVVSLRRSRSPFRRRQSCSWPHLRSSASTHPRPRAAASRSLSHATRWGTRHVAWSWVYPWEPRAKRPGLDLQTRGRPALSSPCSDRRQYASWRKFPRAPS